MEKFKTDLFNTYYKYTRKYSVSADQKTVLATVYIIFTLIMASILTAFAIQPALSTVASLQTQLSQNKQVEEQMHSKLIALNALSTAYTQLTPDLLSVYLAVPKNPQIPYVTRQLEDNAQAAQVNITNLTFNTLELYPIQQPAQPLFSFTFTMTVNGSQDAINQFIAALITFDRIVSIDRIASGKSINKASYETSIVGRAYYYNQ